MKRSSPSSCFLLGLVALFPLVSGCDYARMKDDEAVNTYQTVLPATPAQTVPAAGGIEALRAADPRALVNPLPPGPESVALGRESYGFYCVHCHGPEADGAGTVGQSFSPLPADLKAAAVQTQSDGELFSKISLGFKRHPPLAATVSENERWAVIRYLRTLAAPGPEAP